MNKFLIGIALTVLVSTAGCSSSSNKSDSNEADNAVSDQTDVSSGADESTAADLLAESGAPAPDFPDWAGQVCGSPVYQTMLGSFRGPLTFSDDNRLCSWDVTVVIDGQNNGDSCEISGSVDTQLIEQGTQLEGENAYLCSSGNFDVGVVNGLQNGDDLSTARSIRIIFQFPPERLAQDENNISFLHPIENLSVLLTTSEGLEGSNGTLFRQ